MVGMQNTLIMVAAPLGSMGTLHYLDSQEPGRSSFDIVLVKDSSAFFFRIAKGTASSSDGTERWCWEYRLGLSAAAIAAKPSKRGLYSIGSTTLCSKTIAFSLFASCEITGRISAAISLSSNGNNIFLKLPSLNKYFIRAFGPNFATFIPTSLEVG
jgi:hypothetical protein